MSDDQTLPEYILQLVRIAETVREENYRFVTITPASHALVNARTANARARSLTDVFGWSRPFGSDVLPAHLFALLSEAGLVDRDGSEWRSKIRFSTMDGDLFMHSAFPTVARDAVFFGPDTYKFVDAIKFFLSGRNGAIPRAVDICAGVGPGALTIAKAAPEAEVLMVDINPVALQYAAANAALARRVNVRAVSSSLLDDVEGDFDLIVAHPPYLIDRDERAYRHGGGPLGAGLSLAIVKASIERLMPGGGFLLFTGIAMIDGADPFSAAIAPILTRPDLNWSYREVDPDVFGEELAYECYREVDRIGLVVLTVTKRERPFL